MYVPYGGQSFGRRGVRTEQHTLVVERCDKQALRYTLHDNRRDPYQQNNIADTQTGLVDHLIAQELLPWLERTCDPWRPAPFDSSGPGKQAKLST